MKKSVSTKIEALLSSLYGYAMPNKTENKAPLREEKKEGVRRQCSNLPFEFIRLLF
jgi:hypothetical protein